MSEAAPAGPTANLVNADVSLVKPPPYTGQFWKRDHTVLPSLSRNHPWPLALDVERAPSPQHFQQRERKHSRTSTHPFTHRNRHDRRNHDVQRKHHDPPPNRMHPEPQPPQILRPCRPLERPPNPRAGANRHPRADVLPLAEL